MLSFPSFITFAAVFAMSVLGLTGGVVLLWHQDRMKKIGHYFVSFAAGAMLTVAFLDVLPEAYEQAERFYVTPKTLFVCTFISILVFYLIEKMSLWNHCHEPECQAHTTAWMMVIGDTVHNFLDGILIATAFFISLPLGITTTVAVLFHELPQEIGDFAVLLHFGWSRVKIIVVNLFSALASMVGAFVAMVSIENAEYVSVYLLAFAVGNFIYVAMADLMPLTHKESKREAIVVHTSMLLLGVLLMVLVGLFE